MDRWILTGLERIIKGAESLSLTITSNRRVGNITNALNAYLIDHKRLQSIQEQNTNTFCSSALKTAGDGKPKTLNELALYS